MSPVYWLALVSLMPSHLVAEPIDQGVASVSSRGPVASPVAEIARGWMIDGQRSSPFKTRPFCIAAGRPSLQSKVDTAVFRAVLFVRRKGFRRDQINPFRDELPGLQQVVFHRLRTLLGEVL